MNRSTLIWVALAVASAAGAYSMRPVKMVPPVYEDTNEPLFPGFEDPNAAASLEVQAWNDEESTMVAFKVELIEGKWVIPSHNNYPADGVERMGKAAASFIGVRKDIIRSNDPNEHGAFGVKSPDDIDAQPEEKGTRVVIKDLSGTALVDIIVGTDVADKRGFKYVRMPDKNRVYAAKMELDISTKFSDWIEDDLLHLERDDIVALESNAYKVDESTQRVVDNELLRFERESKSSSQRDWKLAADVKVPKGKEFKDATVRQVLGAMDRLKIVGVRPQPKRLDTLTLQSKGFFVSPEQRRLYGNEGEVSAISEDGVIYTLYFGEITKLRGTALTGGVGAEGSETPEDDTGTAHRFMFVNVTYDPSRDRTRPADADADSGSAAEGEAGADAAANAKAGDDDEGKDSAADAEAEGKADAGEDAKSGGRERAIELRKRFDQWFYVISDSSFKQIRKSPDDYWKDAKPDKK